MSGIALPRIVTTRHRSVPDCRISGVSVALHRRGLCAGNAVLEIDAVTRRHAEQVGGAPDYIVLELVDLAIGVHQFPHHFDNAEPTGFINRAHDDAGEMIEVDRLAL